MPDPSPSTQGSRHFLASCNAFLVGFRFGMQVTLRPPFALQNCQVSFYCRGSLGAAEVAHALPATPAPTQFAAHSAM